MDVQADAWDFLRARDLVDDGDAAEASGAGVLLTDEAREVKLENGLLFAQILKHYDVRCRPSQPASLFLRARDRGYARAVRVQSTWYYTATWHCSSEVQRPVHLADRRTKLMVRRICRIELHPQPVHRHV